MYAVCGGVAAVHVCVGTGVRMCGWMYIGLQCMLLLPTGLGLSSDSFFVHVLVLYMYMSFFTDLMDDLKHHHFVTSFILSAHWHTCIM